MTEAEKYYRSKYPKVNKLSHMDNEIISILEGYEKTLNQGQSLPIGSDSVCEYYQPDKNSTAMNCINCGMPPFSHQI